MNRRFRADWEPYGNRARIRKFLGDPAWCDGDTGVRAVREVAKNITETFYRKENRPSAGIRAYQDYREMLEQERDIQGIVNITPDYQHASINISALKKGDAWVNEKRVSSGGRVSQIGLPKASTIRWRHPATAARPAVDTFWYDGGMKPQTTSSTSMTRSAAP